jgi:MFS family permease
MPNRSFLIAALSAFVQYYDYHLFGFLAVKVARDLLPTQGIILQLQNAYLIMAIAMIAKPIGALILGKLGDIYGRSYIFNISLIGTATGSLIIAFIPNYDSIGIVASIILLLARMIICALVSSGSDSVRIYIYEHINPKKQYLGVSLTNIFTQGGSLAASLAAGFFTLDYMPDYLWRGAFLLGSMMGLAVIFFKYKLKIIDNTNIKDSPKYEEFKNLSILKIIKKNIKLFICCLIIAGCIGSTTQFFIIFFGTYNFEILKNISQHKMQFYTSCSIVFYMIFSIISGYICDIINPFKVITCAIILLLILSFRYIYASDHQHFNVFSFFAIISSLPFLTMPTAVILKQSIPIIIRYRIFTLSHSLGSIFISAPTAFISTWIYHKTDLSWSPIIYFIIIIILISISLKTIKNIKH